MEQVRNVKELLLSLRSCVGGSLTYENLSLQTFRSLPTRVWKPGPRGSRMSCPEGRSQANPLVQCVKN